MTAALRFDQIRLPEEYEALRRDVRAFLAMRRHRGLVASIVMSIASGFISSWLTPTLTAVISTYMLFFSSVVTMYGAHTRNYNFIIIGRIIFGSFIDANQVG